MWHPICEQIHLEGKQNIKYDFLFKLNKTKKEESESQYLINDIIDSLFKYIQDNNRDNNKNEMVKILREMRYDIDINMDDFKIINDPYNKHIFTLGMLHMLNELLNKKIGNEIQKNEFDKMCKECKYARAIVEVIGKNEGITLKEISKILNVSYCTIYRSLLKIDKYRVWYLVKIGKDNRLYTTQLGQQFLNNE